MAYGISYIVAGLLIAIAAAVHERRTVSHRYREEHSTYQTTIPMILVRSAITIVFWPFLIFIDPDFIIGRLLAERRKSEIVAANITPDSVFIGIQDLSTTELAALSDIERNHLNRISEAGRWGVTFFADHTDFDDVLGRFWQEAIPPEAYAAICVAEVKLREPPAYDGEVMASINYSEPAWYVGFSTEFVKSITNLDKNKRARLLEAIGRLATAPTTPHGDTVKPLTGDLAGLWRYRMGDDRLIYKPFAPGRKVLLISFGPRGEAYEGIT